MPFWITKRLVWMQCVNFLWEAVVMPCSLADGISGLVQRISDVILISFSFLQCVWSMLLTYIIALYLSM